MKILIVDNNILRNSWGASELAALAAHTVGATVTVRRAPQSDLPKDLTQFDRVVLSGSMTRATDQAPWITLLDRAISVWIERGTPLLGICYGHQSIARVMGGLHAVRVAPQSEYGWTEIKKIADHPLLVGLPERFYSFSYHQDEVATLPHEFKLGATSVDCEIQAFYHSSKPVYGLQFHPERRLEKGAQDLIGRIKRGETRGLQNATDGKKLYNPDVGATIFKNFFELK